MLSHVQDLAAQITDWEFIELWVDPIIFPPRIIMLVSTKQGNCCIYDPAANYKPIFSCSTYDDAHSWRRRR